MIKVHGFPIKSLLTILCTLVLVNGCSIGPRVLPTDYIGYNKSIQKSVRKEILLNLVRLRYLETPFFLQIGAISSTHQYSTTLGGNASFPDKRLPELGILNSYGLTIGGSAAQTPTVTYSPLTGEQYVERILTDITLADFFSLYDTGWNAVVGTLCSVLIEQIGDLKYIIDSDGDQGQSVLKMKELFDILNQMQNRGDLEFNIIQGEPVVLSDRVSEAQVTPASIIAADRAGYYYHPRSNGNYELRKDSGIRYVMSLHYRNFEEAGKVASYLGIRRKPTRSGEKELSDIIELSPVKSMARKNRKKRDIPVITVDMRSFQQVLLDLSAGVDLPDSDLEKMTFSGAMGPDIVAETYKDYIKPILHIKSSVTSQKESELSIYYRGHWFHIDNKDIASQIAFDLVTVLFSMKAAQKTGIIPALTIPVR